MRKPRHREISASVPAQDLAEVLMSIPKVGTHADFARVEDGEAAKVLG